MIENIQRRYTSQIWEYQTWDAEQNRYVCSTNYWDRLKDLKIYSLQRRRERFAILCVYRIIIGIMEYQGFEVYMERGLKVRTKYDPRAPPSMRRIRHSSFFYKGPQLYNLLPPELRQFQEIEVPSQSNVDQFKKNLDRYLENIPDQPDVPDLNHFRAAKTNSLICQIPVFKRANPDFRVVLTDD